ncbi:MAG: Sec-independent protein translocase protein TatB [Desulfohalobiaceae bacterium]|nr:Sec-independent protein translocase protein TatB [Desulfohalobiaceae bacterium]MCF8085371.1 Sec-independent protein translocase protein TatB [Desulfohalobiaceae bacterium]
MFSLGTTEILVILVVALLVIGPSKLPDVARTLGKGMAEFRRMSSDVKKTVDLETKLSDLDRQEKDKAADAAIGAGSESGEQKDGERASPSEDDSSSSPDGADSDVTGDSKGQERADSDEPDKGSRA